MTVKKLVTGTEGGLTGDDQIRIALKCIIRNGGVATIKDIYQAAEGVLAEKELALSDQGKASLRFFVNKVAVSAGYIYPYDRSNPGWRATAKGREFAAEDIPAIETVLDIDTGEEKQVESNVVRGDAFENFILRVLKMAYPYYSWYHQGTHKKWERGLDFIGERIGDAGPEPRSIGVQVKFHAKNNAPTQEEWLKFLSGCFARRVDTAIFITTGELTPEQRREAREARIKVVEGRDEVERLANLYGIEQFSLFAKS